MKACLILTLSIYMCVYVVQLNLIQYIDNVSKHMIFILGKDGIRFYRQKYFLKYIRLYITYHYNVGRV